MPDSNEVGALWKKTNERGTYYTGTFDVDRLLELTGGETGNRIAIVAYPVTEKANPAQPDLRLKFYGGTSAKPKAATRLVKPPSEDEIPF